LNGKLHRADGPAIEWANGDKHWWLNGELHREDGPACEFANGDKHWYLNGKRLSEDEFNLNMNVKEYSKKEITSEGTFWRNERSEYHRVDGPACEFANGTKHWYLNGQLHREDGPAVENVNGNRLWYLNGKCHREDGPACEYADGYKEWFLNGKRLSKEEFTSACKAKKPDACLANAQPEYYQSGTRIAIHQLKELIFSIISSQSPNAAKPFLTSTIGQSIIMLASGIYLSENSAFSTIAQELRVSAITNAGNALIEEVYNAVLPEIKVAIGQPEIKLIENNEEIFEEHPLTNLHMNQY
jgi:antitoxin component YwqK of YwqJK toxin-antitoxin module